MKRPQRLLRQVRKGRRRFDPTHPMLEREAEDRLFRDQVRNIVGAPIPNELDLGSCRLCSGMEDADKIVVIVGRRRGIVYAEKIDPATFPALEGHHDPKKVGIRLDMRSSKPRRHAADSNMLRPWVEQADILQRYGKRFGDSKQHLTASDLILVRHTIRGTDLLAFGENPLLDTPHFSNLPANFLQLLYPGAERAPVCGALGIHGNRSLGVKNLEHLADAS